MQLQLKVVIHKLGLRDRGCVIFFKNLMCGKCVAASGFFKGNYQQTTKHFRCVSADCTPRLKIKSHKKKKICDRKLNFVTFFTWKLARTIIRTGNGF